MENRIIKFRGKRIKDGKWIYGNLADYSMKVFNTTIEKKVIFGNIVSFATDNFGFVVDDCAVDPETIGQFTGLRDKDSRPIYEGDIVMQRGYSGVKPMVVRFEQGAFIVGWHGGSSTQTRPMLIQKRCEVIGNVIDNPDLLNGK